MMTTHIVKRHLPFLDTSTSALFFIPKERTVHSLAVFTHGYTSHKASILSWAIRLSEHGIPTALFDLPGHLLGHAPEITHFEDFSTQAHTLFVEAHKVLQEIVGSREKLLILGGHSLGALLSLKSLSLFGNHKTINICVGLGMQDSREKHIYESIFFKKTMDFRSGFVSQALSPNRMFPWIKKEKENLQIEDRHIYLLCGDDDIVVGEDGPERLQTFLQEQNNCVILDRPKRFPHNNPDRAASFIKSFLVRQKIL